MLGLVWQAVRSWKTAIPVAVLAAVGLAIGIGSATGIFSVVEAVLLKPLPYPQADRELLVRAEWRKNPGSWTIFSYGDYRDYAARVSKMDAFGCLQYKPFNISFHNQASHVYGTQMSASLLRMLAIPPVRGQWFGEKDQEVVLISEGLWHRLGSSASIVGDAMNVNGVPFTVIGVMPAWFRFPDDTAARSELWVPINPDPDQLTYRGYHYLSCLALPKAGVNEAEARADIQRVLNQLRQEQPADANEPEVITTEPFLEDIVRYIRPRLLLLLVAACALLLITCANVASVLLARSVARGRETAVRVALGATTWQLGVQYFLEGLVVALVGAALGTALAYQLVREIVKIAADQIPRADQISADSRVLAFALLIAVLASLLFSLAPLWQAARTQPNAVLSDGVRSSASATNRRLLRLFVIAEVTLAFALLATGGILWERLTSLERVNPGFDPDNLLLANIFGSPAKYPGESGNIYRTRLLETVQHLPGVEAAGFTSLMPFVGEGNNTALQVLRGPQKPWAEINNGFVEQRFVSPSYFKTLKIPLIAGRFLNDADGKGKEIALVINQSLAREEWGDENPIGSAVKLQSWEEPIFRVVGVVGDVRNFGLGVAPHPEFYMSFRATGSNEMQWAIRSKLDEVTLTREVRRAVESVDPEQSIYSVQTMREAIEGSLSTEKVQSVVLALFAAAALILSVIGVYGVVSYTVRQRTTEIGTRMALGADSRGVVKLVMGDGLRMSTFGTMLGLVVLWALSRLLAATEFQMQVDDAWPFIYAALVIGSLTLLASWFPAWRAAGLPPMIAIRNDLGSSWQESKLQYRQLFERATRNIGFQNTGVEEASLLANMVAAGRNAESFAEAIEAALNVLREELETEKVLLLAQFAPNQPFRSTEDVQLSIPSDAFLIRRLKGWASPLPLSQAELDAWEHYARASSPGRLEEIATLRKIDPALSVPIFSKTEIIGVLLLGAPPEGYSAETLSALRPAAAQLGLMLENERLTSRIVEQERLRRELLLATEVQKRLFPEAWPQTTSIQLAGMCMPARGVGGDYYDFLDLGNRQVGVALADVAGKGIAAALIMSVVQASLRSLTDMRNGSLADLASRMNRLLHRSTGSNSYATFFYAQIDEGNHELRYVNAGHNPPMLLRGPGWNNALVPFVASSANVEELATGGTIIGMFAQASYEEARIELRTGDVLILFSDGVSEAHNPAEEEFGEDRLKELLRKVWHLPINEMCTAVTEDLKKWMLDAPQHDDLTFVLMKVV